MTAAPAAKKRGLVPIGSFRWLCSIVCCLLAVSLSFVDAAWGQAASGKGGPAEPPNNSQDAGEDLGQPRRQQTAALQQIAAAMRQAQQELARPSTGPDAQQPQRKALEQLQKLIQQLGDQAPGGPSSGGSGAAPQVGAANQGDAAEPQPEGPPTPPSDDPGITAVWGHLPARLRNKMRAAGIERFLPKYQMQLEAYYNRLAESPADRP